MEMFTATWFVWVFMAVVHQTSGRLVFTSANDTKCPIIMQRRHFGCVVNGVQLAKFSMCPMYEESCIKTEETITTTTTMSPSPLSPQQLLRPQSSTNPNNVRIEMKIGQILKKWNDIRTEMRQVSSSYQRRHKGYQDDLTRISESIMLINEELTHRMDELNKDNLGTKADIRRFEIVFKNCSRILEEIRNEQNDMLTFLTGTTSQYSNATRYLENRLNNLTLAFTETNGNISLSHELIAQLKEKLMSLERFTRSVGEEGLANKVLYKTFTCASSPAAGLVKTCNMYHTPGSSAFCRRYENNCNICTDPSTPCNGIPCERDLHCQTHMERNIFNCTTFTCETHKEGDWKVIALCVALTILSSAIVVLVFVPPMNRQRIMRFCRLLRHRQITPPEEEVSGSDVNNGFVDTSGLAQVDRQIYRGTTNLIRMSSCLRTTGSDDETNGATSSLSEGNQESEKEKSDTCSERQNVTNE